MFGARRHHSTAEAYSTQVNVHTLETAVARPGDLSAAPVTRDRHLQHGTVARNKCLNLYNSHTCTQYYK